MEISTGGAVIEWRGPAPYFFVPLDHDAADSIAEIAPLVSYGWGCIPVAARLGSTDFTTALIPKGETYLLPLKVDVRRRESVDLGAHVRVTLTIEEGPR